MGNISLMCFCAGSYCRCADEAFLYKWEIETLNFQLVKNERNPIRSQIFLLGYKTLKKSNSRALLGNLFLQTSELHD